MARIRSVHPGFWTDEVTMALTMENPLGIPLLIGLWNEADDQGLFEWKPLTLKARILPAAVCNVAELLDDLEARGAVCRYEVKGKTYGAIRNFRVWQKPKTPNAVHPITDEIRIFVGLDKPISETAADDDGQFPNRFGNTSEKHRLMEDGGGKREDGGKKEADASPPEAPAPPAKPVKRAGKIPLPSDWTPHAEHRAKAAALQVDCDLEAEKMRHWADSGGARCQNWNARFFNWLIKAAEFGNGRQQHHHTRSAPRGKPALSEGWMAGAVSAIEALEGGGVAD